ncbi:MAG TPA: hypothetical protein VI755_11615 [Anaerolineales bacterium]|nr:hypothetical protein [Anaerolineales bacterium]
MAIPAAYTEKTLGQYMQTLLGKVASALALTAGPSDAGDFSEAVNDAVLACGTTDISTITGLANITKLRALARVAAWRYVVDNFAALYDFSADGGSYSRSQLFKQAKESLVLAQQAALPYDPAYQAQVVAIDQKHDPYAYRPEDETGI